MNVNLPSHYKTALPASCEANPVTLGEVKGPRVSGFAPRIAVSGFRETSAGCEATRGPETSFRQPITREFGFAQ
jgi:hypothetical protein